MYEILRVVSGTGTWIMVIGVVLAMATGVFQKKHYQDYVDPVNGAHLRFATERAFEDHVRPEICARDIPGDTSEQRISFCNGAYFGGSYANP